MSRTIQPPTTSSLAASTSPSASYQLDTRCGTDDLGLQTGAFIPEPLFRRLFAPHYARVFAACHASGLLAYLHSDGRRNELAPVLVEAGLDILQVEDIRVKGIDELAKLRGEVAFQCTLDAQSTMPLGTREEIELEAREMVASLATPRGGFFVSIYWDPASLGVSDERQRLGVGAFLAACTAAQS